MSRDRIPQKYHDAYRLIKDRKEDEFLAFAAANSFDYDMHGFGDMTRRDDTLLLAACQRKMWRAARHIVDKGSPIGWHALARAYGYAPDDLSELMYTRFDTELQNKSDPTVLLREDDQFGTSLLGACIYAHCHIRLLQRLIDGGMSPNQKMRDEFHGRRYSIASALLHIQRPTFMFNPAAFIWLCGKYTKEQLGIQDSDIDAVIQDWDRDEFASRLIPPSANERNDERIDEYSNSPDDAERVFWLLESMYSDAKEFRKRVAQLVPHVQEDAHEGARRLIQMLAACGVISSANPRMVEAGRAVATTVDCATCSGSGKVHGVDEELVRQAKKRRFDAVIAGPKK